MEQMGIKGVFSIHTIPDSFSSAGFQEQNHQHDLLRLGRFPPMNHQSLLRIRICSCCSPFRKEVSKNVRNGVKYCL